MSDLAIQARRLTTRAWTTRSWPSPDRPRRIIVAALGLSLGWRPHLDVAAFFEMTGLILLGLLAFTSFGVLLGMLLRSADAIQGIGFAVVFPMAFLGGTFVPIAGMQLVPRTIASHRQLPGVWKLPAIR